MQNFNSKFLCPVCQYDIYKILFPYAGVTEAFKNRELVKCSRCSAISMHPILTNFESSNYYEKGYWTDEIYIRRTPSLLQQAISRCQFMKSDIIFDQKLSVLDVGAGVGYMNWGFRAVWTDTTIEYTAIEVNPAAVKFLCADSGVNNVAKSFDEINGKFDVIVLSHILEHISTPNEFLGMIKGYLRKPNGCIYIEVPNQDFRFKSRNEPHVLFYSPESIKIILTNQRLEITKIETCGQPIWKKRADAGLGKLHFLTSLRKIFYNFSVHSKSEYYMYGGDRQWIRATCKIGDQSNYLL